MTDRSDCFTETSTAKPRIVRASSCSTCGELARPGQRTCHACHAAYQKRWRQKRRAEWDRLRSIVRAD